MVSRGVDVVHAVEVVEVVEVVHVLEMVEVVVTESPTLDGSDGQYRGPFELCVRKQNKKR